MIDLNRKTVVFISGLHKSGTSFLNSLIGSSNEVSRFLNTGFPEDEGQYLQTLFPITENFIGPGKFAFNNNAHFTEISKYLEMKNILISDWTKNWDLQKSILLEKSPPNLIRTRFLQEIFPNTKFITIIRHPIANSYAVKKWTKNIFIGKLIKHWIIAHKIYFNDRKYLKNELCLAYEDFNFDFDNTIKKIGDFLNIDIEPNRIFKESNELYFDAWHGRKLNKFKFFIRQFEKEYIIYKFEKEVKKFGYSLKDLNKNELSKIIR